MAGLIAGAWEYCSHPIDLEPVFVKLETFIRARGELLVARSEEFVNAATGLYTTFGFRQLAGKLGAGSLRKHEAFACVAVAAQIKDREVGSSMLWKDSPEAFADLAHVFREQSRQSDVVGHVGDTRIAILAGYSAVSDLATAKVNVADLVHRAESALDHAPIQGDRSAIVSFDDLPTS